MRTIWITFGLVGFGVTREALFPEVRLGLVAIGMCRGALRDHIGKFRAYARAALAAVRP
jgi:hypothetical protein